MATLSGVRLNPCNDNFLSESEQDANAVLTELDKGLRSNKLGMQCEAIVRFPRLFEKYPFPILVNSSFLKLAEFFYTGTNLLRFWVLRVCQLSENHLDKILNIDSFLKRIFMVIHANDPVARALTLRTLGAVSRVIPEKQQVHHAIRRALDSRDTIEVEAAIFASGQFAAQSRSFAVSMCAKISDMIESLEIPVPMKLQLIPILRHMHHDTNTAAMVKELCLKLMTVYPAQSFIISILDTLTQLSMRDLTGVSDQVNLVLESLADPRKPVRGQALSSLTMLAEDQCVHAWPKPVISILIAKTKACGDPREQYLYLSILLKLSNCELIAHSLVNEHHDAIVDLSVTCICQQQFDTASEAMAILAALIVYSESDAKKLPDTMELVKLHIEGLIFCTIDDEQNAHNLGKILKSGIRIASVNKEFNNNLVTLITGLMCDDSDLPSITSEVMWTALGALCSIYQLEKFALAPVATTSMETDQVETPKEVVVNPVFKRLSMLLYKMNFMMDCSVKPEQFRTIEIISAVALQTMIGCFVPPEVIKCFERCCAHTNCWTMYRIARSASRYGQHFLAAHLFSKLSRNIAVDKFHFFMVGLSQMEQGECILNYGVEYAFMLDNYEKCEPRVVAETTDGSGVAVLPLIRRIEAAINMYWQALANMRASSLSLYPMTFQLEWIKLRVQFLQTLHTALIMRNAHLIVPPPAIAGSLAQSSRDHLLKFGHVTHQLRKLVKLLKGCEESYTRLYKSAFDADPVTLEFLEIAEYQCALLGHIVETICYATPSDPPVSLTVGQYPETRYFAKCCHEMEKIQMSMPQEPDNMKTIGTCHMEAIVALINVITTLPICLPRFFFQVLQSTQIKLSVSPQPRIAGEPISVQSGSNLVIKIEGIIQHHGTKRSLYRRIESVQFTLTSQLVSTRPIIEAQKIASETVTLIQTVKPNRDFLCANFLLPISDAGQWQVMLETYVIDEEGITWCTGPKHNMSVRVHDDPNKPRPSSPPTGHMRRF